MALMAPVLLMERVLLTLLVLPMLSVPLIVLVMTVVPLASLLSQRPFSVHPTTSQQPSLPVAWTLQPAWGQMPQQRRAARQLPMGA